MNTLARHCIVAKELAYHSCSKTPGSVLKVRSPACKTQADDPSASQMAGELFQMMEVHVATSPVRQNYPTACPRRFLWNVQDALKVTILHRNLH